MMVIATVRYIQNILKARGTGPLGLPGDQLADIPPREFILATILLTLSMLEDTKH